MIVDYSIFVPVLGPIHPNTKKKKRAVCLHEPLQVIVFWTPEDNHLQGHERGQRQNTMKRKDFGFAESKDLRDTDLRD